MSLFALPFLGFGLWMGWSAGSNLYDAWRMGDWVQTEALLTRGGYTRHSGDDSDTFKAYAEYTYMVAGRSYTGNRVGLSSGADNIGDYQVDIGRNLAASQGQHIMVWVNPDNPAQSIIDRGVRWGLIGFKSIFLFVFGGIGFGMLYLGWRTPKQKDKSDPRYAEAPWLINDDWQTAEIRSSSKASMIGMWAFAGLWNLISAPLPFVLYDEVVDKENYLALIGLLFPLVGIGMLVWAIRRTREWRRFGPTPVVLDPFPGSIGGHVGGTIDIAIPYDASNEFQLTLTNFNSYTSGSGKNRSQKEKALWQDSIVAHTEHSARGTRLTFRFDVPQDLNESDTEHDDNYHLWRLDLSAELDGTNLDRSFEIPVYATATKSTKLSELAVERARKKQDDISDRAVLETIRIRTGSRGRSMLYPIGRNFGASLVGIVVGGAFAAAGYWIAVEEGQRIFGSIFGGIGALVALLTFYMMSNSLEVGRDATGFWTLRRVLGIPVKRRHMASHEFREFTKESRYQSQGGGKHVMHYSVFAIDKNGNKVIVGENFKGDSEANAGIRLISRELGLSGDERRDDRDSRDRAWDPAGLLSG